MKLSVRKYKSWQEIPKNSKDFWQNKSDNEQLEALENLRNQIFWLKPELQNERPLPRIYPIVKRREMED